jgi:hypothetical protein
VFRGPSCWVFLEGTCIDLSALHRFVYKQDPKEKENYKEVQNSCSSSLKPSAIRSSPSSKPLPNHRWAPKSNSTKWRPQRRAYCYANQPSTLPHAHRPTLVPTTHPSVPPPATRAVLKFLPKIIFLDINRVNNIITWRRRRVDDTPTLDSWTGFPSLSVDVGVDRHRRTERLGEIIPPQHRRFRIAGAARKTKPQRSHAPPAKPNSTTEHRRWVNPKPKQTRLWLNLPKGWTLAPLATG